MDFCKLDQAPTDCRSNSPVKPKDDAVEPSETAHEEMSELNNGEANANNSAKTITAGTSKMNTDASDEVDGDITAVAESSDIITKTMVEEEMQLHKQTEKEEEKMKKEQEKLWDNMDQADREHRYKRLQFLLSKSSMYTRYLLERMEKQREDDQKRKERKTKKEEKMKALVEKKKADSQEGAAQDPEPRKLGVRNTRGRKSKEVNDKESSGSLPSSQESGSGSKKGRKRKIESSNGDGQITDFKTKGKKQKLNDSSAKDTTVNRSCDQSEMKENKSENVTLEQTAVKLNREVESNEKKNVSQMVKVQSDDAANTISSSQDDILSEEEDDSKVFDGSINGQPVLLTGGTLRDYQITGFTWLKTLYENGVNGILADEMGLGKTVQCVAMLSHLVHMGVPGPFLVCAPLSTIPNWHMEFRRFSPTVPVILYHGQKDVRERIRNKIRRKVMVRPGLEVFPIVITSYEICMRDRKNLQFIEWRYLIVDEGHRIKNTQCRLIRELRMYQNTHRLLLTGTPLQNNLAELWSLLNFLLPEIFDDLGSFEAWFDVERISAEGANERIIAEEQQKNILSMLHQILTPFMLRRLKQDVDLHIPPKKELIVYAPMSDLQKEFYQATVDKTIFKKIEEKNEIPEKVELNEFGRPVRKSAKQKVQYNLMVGSDKDDSPKKRRNIEKEEEDLEAWIQAMIDNQSKKENTVKEAKVKKSQVTIRLQNVMMQLRKCCNHPYLLEYPLDPKTGDYKMDANLIKCCGKMLILDKMLMELKVRGHKVLIFSQMTKMLDILQDYCYLKNLTYCRLDGSSSVEERQEQMSSFNSNPDIFIFLLSTRAGGLGINLTAADTVVIYDSDWNPQSDLQAQDRCHRIGQTKPVVVYRLVTSNTIDQRVVEKAAAKRKLEKMVIHKGKFKSGMENYNETVKPLSPEELIELLKSKDHDHEVKGKEGEVIGSQELDNLLDRSDLYEKWGKKGKNPVKTGKTSKAKKTKKTSSEEVEGLYKVIDMETDSSNKDITEEIPGVSPLVS